MKKVLQNWTSETPNLLNQLASEFEQMSNFTCLEMKSSAKNGRKQSSFCGEE